MLKRLTNYKAIALDDGSIDCACPSDNLSKRYKDHIMDSDCDAIRDKDIKEACLKGAKFVPFFPVHASNKLDMVYENICANLDEHWIKYNKSWAKLIAHEVCNKMNNMPDRNECAPMYKHHADQIKMLRDKYAITYIDKAGQNMVFMCRQLYLKLVEQQVLMSSSSGTYQICKLTPDSNYYGFAKEISDMDISPNLSIVKAHKEPLKFWAIVSSRNSYIESVERIMASCLKEVSQKHLNYTHKTIYSGLLSTNLMVDNHKPALDSLSMLSSKGQAKAVDSFDFSDMCTALQHELVTDAISSAVIKSVNVWTRTSS